MSSLSFRFPARTLSTTRYAETFATFVSRSSEYTQMMNRLVEAASVLPPNFHMLDVGAGTGTLLRDWKRYSTIRNMPGRYVAVEPNATHVSQLRKTMAVLRIEGNVLEESFDTITTLQQQNMFDMVLFSHSLFWLPNPVGCIQKALSWLKPGGVVLIFHQGPFLFYTLYHLFNPLLERNVPIQPNHGLSSHEIVLGLRQYGLKKHVDLTDLSEHDRNEILSFSLQVEVKELQDPLQSDIIQYFFAACVETADNKLLFHHPNVTISVCNKD